MHPRARAAALLLVLGLGLLAWWVLGPGGAGGRLGVARPRTDNAAPTGSPLAPTPSAPTLTPAPGLAPRSARPRWTLSVRVLGLPPEEAKEITLHLSARGRFGPDETGVRDVRCDPSGTTEIDVEAMALRPEWHTLQVMADGPWHLPSYAALALPPDLEERRKGLDLALEVRPERAGALVGRVVGPDGKPLAGVMVTQDVAGGSDGEEGRGFGVAVVSDVEGRFRVLARPGPRLVALVWSPAYGPGASAPVSLAAAAAMDVGTIRLLPGQGLAGLARGVDGLPPASVMLHAMWLGASRPSEVPGVAWTQVTPFRSRMDVLVDPEGRFTLEDVASGWWRVQLEAPDWGCAAVHEVLRGSLRIAHTRDGPLRLDAARARLSFAVTSDGRPFGGATVIVAGDERLSWSTQDGQGCLVVRPRTRYGLTVFASGMQTLVTSVTSPPNGQEAHLELALSPGKDAPPADVAWTARARLRFRLTVTGPNGQTLPAHVTLSDSEGRSVPAAWVERYPVVTWLTDGHLLGLGQAELVTDLERREYRVHVECDGMRPQSMGLWLPPDVNEPWEIEAQLAPE